EQEQEHIGAGLAPCAHGARPAPRALRLPYRLHTTRYDRVLCTDDLPLPVALQPSVSPDLAPLGLSAIGSLADSTFRSVRNGHGTAKESHPYIAELAVACRRFGVSSDSRCLCIAVAVSRRALKVVRNHSIETELRAALGVGPLRLTRGDELDSRFVR